LDLAKQTKTVTMNWDGRQSVFDHLGHRMSEKEAAENEEVVWGIIEQAMKYSNEESATIPAEKSLYNFFEEQVEKMFPSKDGDAKAKSKRDTILQMAEMWGAFVGSPIQTQSLKFFWLEECIDGENLFVAGTYRKVLEKIAEPALKADVKFAHKVTKLVSHEDGGDLTVTVELEGRDSETFDEVVMTAPLGWLKRNMAAFEPQLPKRLKEGIEAIGYGHLDKVRFRHYLILEPLLTTCRFTSTFQQLSGTNQSYQLLSHQRAPKIQAYPMSPQQLHQYTKRRPINHPPTRPSTQRTIPASHTGSLQPTPPTPTQTTGNKKP
jgi:hypothetical protein